MTVRDLINKLLDSSMDKEVSLCYEKKHIDKYGIKYSAYVFDIDDVKGNNIMFTDWREEKYGSNNN